MPTTPAVIITPNSRPGRTQGQNQRGPHQHQLEDQADNKRPFEDFQVEHGVNLGMA